MDKKVDLDSWIEKLKSVQKLEEENVIQLCNLVKDILRQESNVVHVKTPVILVGDIHGQLYDLLEMFKTAGAFPGDKNFLFLGDYVDRGHYSLEVVCLCVAYKVRYPNKVVLLRGNHECRQITQVYGFYDECLRKYGSPEVWKNFCDVFDLMPLCAVVDDKIFCTHGGLSPNIATIDDIGKINRQQEIPSDGPVCDLMWSDPDDRDSWGTSPRCAGYTFGASVTEQWNEKNKLILTVRAHQLVMEGYEWAHNKKLITIFSAPNYSYRCGNKAAILEYPSNDLEKFNILTYEAAIRPTEINYISKRTPDYFL